MLLLCSMIPLTSNAETKETRSAQKHEVRIGYGDPMFETMRWKDEPNKLGVPMNARQNYRYTGHIYGEYMYRINRRSVCHGDAVRLRPSRVVQVPWRHC